MQIVINQADFKRLSAGTQKELIEQFSGRKLPDSEIPKRRTDLYWRRPVDPDRVRTLRAALASS